jgi:hypothetical protein
MENTQNTPESNLQQLNEGKTELGYTQLQRLNFTSGMYGLDAESKDKFMAKRANEYWFDPNNLTVKELFALDSRRWDENLVILPLWMRNFFGNGVELTTIRDEKVIVGQDELSLAHKGGLLAYGVIKQVEEQPDNPFEGLNQLAPDEANTKTDVEEFSINYKIRDSE